MPMGKTASSTQLLGVEGDISPVQTCVHLSQVFCPPPIGPATLDYPAIPASTLGITTASTAESEVTQINSPYVEDVNSIDGAEEAGDHTEGTAGEHGYAESTDEEEEYVAPGPSNRRGKKSTRRAREAAAPYSLEENAPNRMYKPRIIADQDNFPHPPIPNPDDPRQQANYNTGKRKWWSQRVLRPLLSASPKPLSKDAILSIIKKDLGLQGDAWRAFHDGHLVRHLFESPDQLYDAFASEFHITNAHSWCKDRSTEGSSGLCAPRARWSVRR